jgi:multiple sugar transport system permease protein
MLLNRQFPGMKNIRSIYFVPVAVSGIVAVSIFRFIFNSGATGPVNALLTSLQSAMGFDPQPVPWLWDSHWAMLTITFITLWKSTAFFSIIILAAMQDVPRDLYEAAAVDGAGLASQFAHITVPSLMPILMMVATLSIIGAFRIFEPMFVLTGGRYETQTITLKAYNSAFQTGELGLANAISFSLLIIILLATLAMNSISRRFE